MLDHIFREYDIRGVVGKELYIEQAYNLARAIATYFQQKKPNIKTISIGMDGRIHSLDIKQEMVRGFCDSGMDVVFIGMCPTPVMYFSLHTMPVDAGIMITASHNPSEYNGVKLCLGKESIFGDEIRAIRDLYKTKQYMSADSVGSYSDVDVVSLYVDYLANHFPTLHDMDLSVVFDCGNAVGGIVMPKLIDALSWKKSDLLYADIDGSYPNHEADPTVEKNMKDVKQKMLTGAYDVGIGFDGDCDRVGAMTKSGYLVPGDQLLALFSQQVLKEYPGTAVVFDVKASSALVETIRSYNGKPCFSSCGVAFIKEKMRQSGALLGGELSCHFCFKDRFFGFDDGIYAALRLLELVVQSGKTFEDLLAPYPMTVHSPEFRISCDESKKKDIVAAVHRSLASRDDASLITIDGVRASFSHGWGLLRASNTQPVLSMRFEAATHDGLQHVKKDFIQAMEPFFNKDDLSKTLNE